MCTGTIGQVVATRPDRSLEVRIGSRVVVASGLVLTEPVRPGDWVLVHSGLVLARLTEAQARDALDLRDNGATTGGT